MGSRRRCRREWHRRRRDSLREVLECSRGFSEGARLGESSSTEAPRDGESAQELATAGAAGTVSSRGVTHHESDAHLAWNAGAKVGKKGPKEQQVAGTGQELQ